MYPPLYLAKVCTKPYNLPPAKSGANPLTVKVGTPIIISLTGVQTDEENFPDAKTFDPERFLEPNKNKFNKDAYMPFGNGPRSCLGEFLKLHPNIECSIHVSGMRFGFMQSKVCLLKLVSNFDMRLNERTENPVKFESKTLFLALKGGTWINFHRLNTNF